MKNSISISALRLKTYLGVPDEERADAQEVSVFIEMEIDRDFREMEDEVSQTVDYAFVAERMKDLALERPRKLVETLVADMVDDLSGNFPIKALSVEVRKFILENTDYIAVKSES